MPLYLHDIPLDKAKAALKEALQNADLWRVLGKENIPLDENALGRILAEPIWAKVSSPHYHASAMDGFAVRAKDTGGATLTAPLTLQIGEQAQYVDTGDPLPEEFNAVIMIEETEALDANGEITSAIREPKSIRIRASVAPWKHVRPLGEDIVATQLVLPAGHILRPADLGAIAASGHTEIPVARKPRVAILPTGTELVEIGSELKRGDILEYNSLVLAAQIKKWGGIATRFPITIDDFDLISQRVAEAARDHDLILLNAGSSAGAEDFSAGVVEKLGTLLVHGVAVRPGHPVIIGMIDNKPIIGMPGYPVSAALTGEIFVEPMIAKWLGRAPIQLDTVKATLTRKTTSSAGDDDYIRMAAGRVGEKMLAAPLNRGAGVISSLVRADGLAIMPRGTQGAEAGDMVDIHLYRTRAELEKTIFCIGSHDMTLDLIAQYLSMRNRRLVSSNVGSLGGLVALKRGEAHLAGSHLLDPETGIYNDSYIAKYLTETPVQQVMLVKREQGLILPRANPKKLKSLEDVVSSGIQFVNRQRGAGTRVLLDYHLNLLGIAPEQVLGYNDEEFTHLGVAAAVASGRADCGLGIAAAAQALELDFVPLFQERYELIIPDIYFDSPLLAPLFEVIKTKEFRETVAEMPGYEFGEE
ncbi:MAG: molybdopterin biosynthesis protein [Anaerolineae bacterium]|jgi:putative molybdopterin biosynthesis protein|nr:molybdopterin biosynthesis protein [Anaerolineae bacterium]MBT4310886.1 molybdopterin biosynthesis protein [Anaerolineae bacterium]MBT4458252.1 molybdopterin biosynthesis protein [Anaerolineae bacterium]MBT4840993.1 molybdopterin biosynthesis protein [Anaerolineae bacterium]MBT6061133.1 molybdopterin biosynthesis protein [Anaerolineae bacterium]